MIALWAGGPARPKKRYLGPVALRAPPEVFVRQVLPRLLGAPAELILEALPPLQPQTRFLEVDAGGGVVARALVERIAGLGRLVTIDEDLALVSGLPAGPRRAARAVGAVAALPFASGTFDVVIANVVLGDPFNDPPRLQELRRVLRPGGWMLATVALEGSYDTLLDVLITAGSAHPSLGEAAVDARDALPDEATLRARVTAAGFNVTHVGIEDRLISMLDGAGVVDDELVRDVLVPALVGLPLAPSVRVAIAHAVDAAFPAGLPLRMKTGIIAARAPVAA